MYDSWAEGWTSSYVGCNLGKLGVGSFCVPQFSVSVLHNICVSVTLRLLMACVVLVRPWYCILNTSVGQTVKLKHCGWIGTTYGDNDWFRTRWCDVIPRAGKWRQLANIKCIQFYTLLVSNRVDNNCLFIEVGFAGYDDTAIQSHGTHGVSSSLWYNFKVHK